MLKIVSVAFLAVMILTGCKSKGKSGNVLEAQLLRLNKLYDSALLHNNTDALKKLYADDFVYTNPDGKLLTRDQQLTSVSTSEMKWESGKSEDVKVKLYGSLAVMTGSFMAKGSYRGNPLTVNERFTVVWIKKDTSWQMVAEQGSIIK